MHEMGWLEKLRYLQKYLYQQNPNTVPELFRLFAGQAELRRALLEDKTPPAARLGLFGDLMWIRDGWSDFLSEEVRRNLAGMDGLVGNLETVISPAFPVREFWPDLINFNSRPELVQAFASGGKSLFAALSFANNHTLDFHDRGALDTLKFLESEKIPHAGLRRDPTERRWAEFTRGGIRFGFFAATFGVNDRRRLSNSKMLLEVIPHLSPHRGGVPADLSGAEAALAEMHAAGVEIKIVSLHWGHEFDFFPQAYQRDVARRLVTAGADIVMGAHSHVAQPDELLFVNGAAAGGASVPFESILNAPGRPRHALVLYGLGNFTTAMYTAPCRLSRVAEVAFVKNENGVSLRPPRNHFFFNQPRGRHAPRTLRVARPEDAPLAAIRAHLGDA